MTDVSGHEEPGAVRLARYGVILGAPMLLVGLLVTHGDISETGADWYRTLHFLLLPLFGLVALAAWWLLRGLRGVAVVLAATALGVFVVYNTALDVTAGVSAPTLQQYSFHVPTASAPWVLGAVGYLQDTVDLYFNAGSWAWVVAMVACALALLRAGRPWPPLLVLALSGLPLALYSHGRPWGPISFGLFVIAALWLELWPSRGPVLPELAFRPCRWTTRSTTDRATSGGTSASR